MTEFGRLCWLAVVGWSVFARPAFAQEICGGWGAVSADDYWDAADFFRSATADTVMACIRAGMDVHVRDGSDATPLHKAAWLSPFPAVINALLAAGADISTRDEDDDTPLHYAAGYNRNPVILNTLIENGAEVNASNRAGDTPLHEEAGSGIPANIRILLEAGAELDARNREGETPLHHAVARDKPANVCALLEGGADVQAGDEYGDTPLHRAVQFHPSHFPFLQSLNRDRIEQALRLDTAIITVLAGAGADLDRRNAIGRTPLHMAWERDVQPFVEKLLELGADPEVPDNWGRIPGPRVCDWSDLFLFRHIPLESVVGCLEAGADPNAITEYGRGGETLLERVVLRRWPNSDAFSDAPAMITALVEVGADVNGLGWNSRGGTPLHTAAGSNRIDIATALLNAGADATRRDGSGRTVLHSAACSSGDPLALMSLLINAGAELDALDDDGRTALHIALERDRPVAFERLLGLGADPDAGAPVDPVNCERWNTALFFRRADAATVAGCIGEGLEVGARSGRWGGNLPPGSSPLHFAAAWARDPAVIPVLVDAGADIAARDEIDHTPLHRAAGEGDVAVVEALLAAGADVDAWTRHPDGHGRLKNYTPLHEAAGGNEDPAVVAVLLDAGADVNARGTSDRTPLHRAAAGNENPAVIALLLRSGADVNARARGGRTPLHEAGARNGNPDVIAALVESGADVHSWGDDADAIRWGYSGLVGPGNANIWTPLHEAAAQNGNPAVVTALIEAGADVNTIGEAGITPLFLATGTNENPGIAEALVRSGADVNEIYPWGGTPLHLAAGSNPAVFPRLLKLGADPAARDKHGRTPLDLARDIQALQGLEIVRRSKGQGGGG